MKREMAVAVTAVLVAGALAAAQERVDEHRSASPQGTVTIENGAGSVRVIGWDKAEVAVTGQLGAGAEGLNVSGSGDSVHVEVETRGAPQAVSSDLEVRVPAGSRVRVEGFSSRITVTDVTGSLDAETVNGSITVTGRPKEVNAEAVNGSVEVDGATRRTHAESVNGPVTVRGAGGEVEASTVNGPLTVTGGAPLDRMSLETVAGTISFDGTLSAKADAHLESVSGQVTLTLPANIGAGFSLSTFSGRVENAFGGPSLPEEGIEGGVKGGVKGGTEGEGTINVRKRRGHPGTEREITFTTGDGGANISINTLSGTIVLRKK